MNGKSKPSRTDSTVHRPSEKKQRTAISRGLDDARNHYRRFASEFIGTFGFVFTLTGGSAIFHAYAHPGLSPGMHLALMTSVCALWLVVAIHALGDVSAHFNPAVTFAFALRGDMSWKRAGAYVVVQCAAGSAAALLARAFFGIESGLSICKP